MSSGAQILSILDSALDCGQKDSLQQLHPHFSMHTQAGISKFLNLSKVI